MSLPPVDAPHDPAAAVPTRPTEPAPPSTARPAWVPWFLLVLGTVAASISAILIRYADTADPMAISFWRCAIGALALLPFARVKMRALQATDLRLPALAGVFLALHFGTWITSVGMTSIAASVLLVTTGPIFIAAVAPFFLGERLSGRGWFGIVVAMLGSLLVAGADFGGSSLDGNVLALIGGAAAGYYMLTGQVARRTLGILEYAVVTYTVAAALLLVWIVVGRIELFAFDAQTWWAIIGLVVGPQLLGHTVLNLVLSDIDATTVSVAVMAEPIIAIAAAWLLFSEVPSLLVYPGGAAILVGIYLVTQARRRVDPPLE